MFHSKLEPYPQGHIHVSVIVDISNIFVELTSSMYDYKNYKKTPICSFVVYKKSFISSFFLFHPRNPKWMSLSTVVLALKKPGLDLDQNWF